MTAEKNNLMAVFFILVCICLLTGCTGVLPAPTEDIPAENNSFGEGQDMAEEILADVLSVEVAGSPNAYQFSVEISSPDAGCDQYADWWEVLNEDGQLLYRRVLLHSHVSEQPFVRSGGPVNIEAETVVLVRAHMNNTGYGGQTIKGSVQSGFNEVQLSADFAADAESKPPLPEGCDF
ncbi:MAG: hypothetical protein MUO54_15480 [Anaerolineales bacterium]|nr:hypothetical protein [Anaerolineales bacterium]